MLINLLQKKKQLPVEGYSPIQVLMKLVRIVSPTAIRLMDDRTSFVQEVPQDLQFCVMILAICVAEDVSKHLDIPIWEFWAIWEHPQILLESMRILRQLLVHHNLVILQWRPWFLQQSSETQTSPAFCTSVVLILTPHFWGDICPSTRQSGLSFCLFVLPE